MVERVLLKSAAMTLAFGLIWAPGFAGVTKFPMHMSFDAGAYCLRPSDHNESAPGTKDGQIGVKDDAYDFIRFGDTVPAFPDVAIGIIFQFDPGQSGATLTIHQRLKEADEEDDVWTTVPGDDGRFWIGREPDPGKPLPVGHYQMDVLRDGKLIFGYEFVVVEPSRIPGFRADCGLNLS